VTLKRVPIPNLRTADLTHNIQITEKKLNSQIFLIKDESFTCFETLPYNLLQWENICCNWTRKTTDHLKIKMSQRVKDERSNSTKYERM
jgi:hypothetical protein